MRRNSHSIAPIFVEDIGRFGKLKIIGLDQFLLEYVEYIKELLDGFPELTTKKYFGGVAFRSAWLGKDMQFGVVLGDAMYFVVDDETRPKYEAKEMKPFSYKKQDKTVIVKKWYSAPEELLDDTELMKAWAMEALEAAARSA